MPNDDIVKRLNNLLQFKTALESTNVSPQYLSNETARRDAIKLENAGNKIDPVTKKPFNRSEKWLQSTGQQIPGLDSEGTSTVEALNVIQTGQLAKLLGQIGKQGVKKVLKDLALKETLKDSRGFPLPEPSILVQDLPFDIPTVIRNYRHELMNLTRNNTRPGISVLEESRLANLHKYDAFDDFISSSRKFDIKDLKDELSDDYMYKRGNSVDLEDVREYTGDLGWRDGFRIVDRPTQNKLPYFSKITDDINKGLAERLAGKDVQLQVEPTNYGYRTKVKGKIGDIDFQDWRYAGSMTLNPSGNALAKGDMLLKPVTEAQTGVDAVFANSSFPFSNLPQTDALIGKGYGKELYRQLNASLKKEYGTRLNSGHNSLSEHSRALWNSLVDKGEAWRIGDPRTTVQYGLYGGLLSTLLANQKDK